MPPPTTLHFFFIFSQKCSVYRWLAVLGSRNLPTLRINNIQMAKRRKCLGFFFLIFPRKFGSDILRFNVPKVNPPSNFYIKKF